MNINPIIWDPINLYRLSLNKIDLDILYLGTTNLDLIYSWALGMRSLAWAGEHNLNLEIGKIKV